MHQEQKKNGRDRPEEEMQVELDRVFKVKYMPGLHLFSKHIKDKIAHNIQIFQLK